ncbi:sensor histidine kinase [Gordoniibacillus kamchatkensis]|uniref:sensor histidine kinase n=1 Tax=Gordoniibacillus kamchatkensis TaxID=1590651 RepID=UPI0006970EF5|nr:histidine kinase [Paenibacillus sp. VKM B-2647]
MSLRQLKLLTVALPTLLIGGFEYARHDWFEHYLSMETGNLYMTLLTLLLAYMFAAWVFRRIEYINRLLAEEEAKRAVYEDRERLARELHDTIAQTLFFAQVMLKQGKLEDARAAVADADQHVRQAIFNLRTPPDEPIGFAARLAAWVRDWSALSGIEAKTDIAVADGALRRDEELQLFAVVQEAFTNIRKHSHASAARLSLHAARRRRRGSWKLRTTGSGSPASAAPGKLERPERTEVSGRAAKPEQTAKGPERMTVPAATQHPLRRQRIAMGWSSCASARRSSAPRSSWRRCKRTARARS